MGRGQEWHPHGQSSKGKALGRLHPGRSQEERFAPNTGAECVHGLGSDAGGCDMTDPRICISGGGIWRSWVMQALAPGCLSFRPFQPHPRAEERRKGCKGL